LYLGFIYLNYSNFFSHSGISHEGNWSLYYRLLVTSTRSRDEARQRFHPLLKKQAKTLRDLVHSNPSYMPLKRDACVANVRALISDPCPQTRERLSHGYLLHLFLSFLVRAVTLSHEGAKALVEDYVRGGGMLNLPVKTLTQYYHISYEQGGMQLICNMSSFVLTI
jgi:hypothetical protein